MGDGEFPLLYDKEPLALCVEDRVEIAGIWHRREKEGGLFLCPAHLLKRGSPRATREQESLGCCGDLRKGMGEMDGRWVVGGAVALEQREPKRGGVWGLLILEEQGKALGFVPRAVEEMFVVGEGLWAAPSGAGLLFELDLLWGCRAT